MQMKMKNIPRDYQDMGFYSTREIARTVKKLHEKVSNVRYAVYQAETRHGDTTYNGWVVCSTSTKLKGK